MGINQSDSTGWYSFYFESCLACVLLDSRFPPTVMDLKCILASHAVADGKDTSSPVTLVRKKTHPREVKKNKKKCKVAKVELGPCKEPR